MKTQIQIGDTVLVKPNVTEELARMKFMSPNGTDDLIDTKQTAYDVYEADEDQLPGEWFVTVDLCCEIPLAACQLYARQPTIDRAKELGLWWRKHEGLDTWSLESKQLYTHPTKGSAPRHYGNAWNLNFFGDNPERGTRFGCDMPKDPTARLDNCTILFDEQPTLAEAMALVEASFVPTIFFF